MEKLLYNQNGPIMYLSGNEAFITDNSIGFEFVVDVPEGFIVSDINNYHVEAGVIVPGVWDNPVAEEPPVGSFVQWVMQVPDVSIKIKNIPPTATGVMDPDVSGTNILALKSSITVASEMGITGDVQLWNTAMSLSFIVLIVAFRSYGCDVVKQGDYIYICTKDHTSDSVLVPGTNEGATVWCPCGDAAIDDGIPVWTESTTYSEGTTSLLGTPPAFVSTFQQCPPQMFTQLTCSSKDTALPDESLSVTEAYYGLRAYMLSDTGGGTSYSDLISLYGTDLLLSTQSIKITKL